MFREIIVPKAQEEHTNYFCRKDNASLFTHMGKKGAFHTPSPHPLSSVFKVWEHKYSHQGGKCYYLTILFAYHVY